MGTKYVSFREKGQGKGKFDLSDCGKTVYNLILYP